MQETDPTPTIKVIDTGPYIRLEDVPEEHRRRAKNNGYYDMPVGWFKTAKFKGDTVSVAYRRQWIEPKYYKKKKNDTE